MAPKPGPSRGGSSEASGALAVNLSAVAHLDHQDDQFGVFDVVHHSVVSDGIRQCFEPTSLVVHLESAYDANLGNNTEVAAILYGLIESAKLAGVGPQTHLKTAIMAALCGNEIPLPHEVA